MDRIIYHEEETVCSARSVMVIMFTISEATGNLIYVGCYCFSEKLKTMLQLTSLYTLYTVEDRLSRSLNTGSVQTTESF
jgi:hypothetical protein